MTRFFRVRRARPKRRIELNLAPLMDMIFILLIFFLVTTTFSRESGIDVEKPTAETAKQIEYPTLVVGVTRDGTVYVEGKQVDIRMLSSEIQKILKDNPEMGIIVIADKDTKTGTLVRILDMCKLAGAGRISIAARRFVR